MFNATQIERELSRLDFFRRSPRWMERFGFHKEWQHFVVHSAELDLLVNFSVCDDTRGGARAGAEVARLVVLVRDLRRDLCEGDVESFPAEEFSIPGGRLTAKLGRRNRMELRNGAFHIHVELRDRPVKMDLQLTPVTRPALVHNISMLEGPPLHWLVTPRLLVDGTVEIAGRAHRLDREPAYHDHNWGPFRWGHDISWEWGFVLPSDPDCPWTLTFVRLTNRGRTEALDQALLLWKDDRLVRRYRQTSVEMTSDPLPLRARQVYKIPSVAALVAPETATDVPRGMRAVARQGADWIECDCTCRHVAQVLIPSETGLGITIFNEVSADSAVRGCIDGEAVSFAGRTTMEFIRECPILC